MALRRGAAPGLRRYGTPAALVLLCLAFAALSPDAFAQPANLINITQQMSLLAIVAIGATFVMVVGEFDLSVSALASWAGILAYSLFALGANLAEAAAAVVLTCAIIGGVSGLLVAALAVPSFVATLSMGTVVGGLTFWASKGATLFGKAPYGFRELARGALLGVPRLTLWLGAVALVASFLLSQTELGRRLYAIGGNRVAAGLAGVPVRRDTVTAFAASAVLAGLAGLLLAAKLGSAHPTGGGGFLLQAYAAAFLGMTAFREGEPNVPGTLVGAGLIAVLANGLTILDVPSFFQDMVTGVIIIVAVLLRRVAGERR